MGLDKNESLMLLDDQPLKSFPKLRDADEAHVTDKTSSKNHNVSIMITG